MDNEKKYNELVGKIKKAYLYAQTGSTKAVLEDILPELCESEDERIRRELIKFIKKRNRSGCDYDYDKWIAYLEKQGDTSMEVTCTQEVEVGNGNIKALVTEELPVDKVETKFHVNEWVVTAINDVVQIKAVNNGRYTIDNGIEYNINMAYVDRYWHKWTIYDAKPGDVLASKDELSILIFRNLDTSTSFSSYYNIQRKGELGWSNECFIPATKEQRDLLFRKMREAGYEWDAEKKELKKIKKTDYEPDASYRQQADDLVDMVTEKPAWSEEDETTRNALINLVEMYYSSYINKSEKNRLLSWLKSLKSLVK